MLPSKRWLRRKSLDLLCVWQDYCPKGIARRWWHVTVRRVIERSGLFDADYYLEQNVDVASEAMDPLDHYIAHGDREGRRPMPLFDPLHYRRNLKPVLPAHRNALLHYLLAGRYLRTELSASFDAAHFYELHRDVKLRGAEPLGWLRHQGFLHESVHVSPFGRTALGPSASMPLEPAEEDWETLGPETRELAPVIDVIVPVFAGRAETLRCLHRVLSSRQETPFELIVIDDACQDECLVARLRALAEKGLITLLHNERNLGFVASCNRALALHGERDAVLLNADTEPHGNWLDRLRAIAHSASDIGTVTPISNNATICSYPLFNRDNPWALEIDARETDQLASRVNAGVTVDAPTGVGFCLYLRRDCLAQTGLLDEEAFGRGYGEENDLCQRAIAAGWRNVIAAEVFVWHWGARSFQGTSRPLIRLARAEIARRHPGYHEAVVDFINRDPLRAARASLDWARLIRHRSARGNALVMIHARGGGAARHMEEEMLRLRRRGIAGFLLLPVKHSKKARLSALGLPKLPNLEPVDLRAPGNLIGLLERLGITEVHVHQLIDFPRGCALELLAACRERGIPVDVFVHDYQFICPRINLVDATGRYCGEPDEAACHKCLEQRIKGIEPPVTTDIRSWRVHHGALFASARRVIVPDRDVKKRLLRYFPHAHYAIRPHEEPGSFPPTVAVYPVDEERPFRIVTIGAISRVKGFDVLKAVASYARKQGMPLEFYLMGFSRKDEELQAEGIRLTGRYHDAQAGDILAGLRADLVWLPAVWPETYSYTLSIALAAGLPVAVFDLGAPPGRLTRHGGHHLILPADLAAKPGIVASRLLDFCLRRRKGAVSKQELAA